MVKKIHGPVVLITGASSGIGRMTTLALSRTGAHMVLVARRADLLHQIAADISVNGGDAVALPGDATRVDTMAQAVEHTVRRFGKLDALINNAGQGLFATLEQTTEEDLDRMLSVNFKSAYYGIKAALPAMRRQGRGHIINVASTAGRRGSPYVGAYCASKFALVGLTESLRTELLESGIRVSLVCPGATRTDFFRTAIRKTSHHSGLVGPVETPERVAARIVKLIRRPRPEVIAQPIRRKLFLILNLLAPGLADRLVARLIASDRSQEDNFDARP